MHWNKCHLRLFQHNMSTITKTSIKQPFQRFQLQIETTIRVCVPVTPSSIWSKTMITEPGWCQKRQQKFNVKTHMQKQKEHTPPNFKMDTLKIAIFEAGDIHLTKVDIHFWGTSQNVTFQGSYPKNHHGSPRSPRIPKRFQRTGHMRRRRGTTIRPIDLATSIESIGVVEEKKHTPYDAPCMEYLPTFWL